MKRILFVDDEQQILDAMRNILRKRRREWDMTFVASGAIALEEMEKSPFDVIVSDMRMPMMDGAQLLEQVWLRFPRTARFVLSGQANSESIIRVLPFAQQFLSKPCDPDSLSRVIERTCELQNCLSDQSIRDSVGGLRALPSSANIYWQLTEAINDEDVPVNRIASIVESDPAIAAKLLQLVNSAFFGLLRRTTSIQQTVSYLGTDLIRSLALSSKVFACYDDDPTLKPIVDRVQQHSLATAKLAVQFLENRSLSDATFTAALLHDVGILGLAKHHPERYRETIELAELSRTPLDQVEKSLGYVPHTAVGGYLLGVWGLPFEIVECATYHHHPNIIGDGSFEIMMAVHAADALLEAAAHPGLDPLAFLDHSAVEKAGYSTCIENWLAVFQKSQQTTPETSQNRP